MKAKMFNATHIEGLLYEHNLEIRTTGANSKNPGTEYIRGTVSIVTDDALTNVVPINYTYITEMIGRDNPKPDARFTELKKIIDGVYGSVMDVGAEKATKLRIDSSIGLNEFYSDRNGTEELVSAKRNDGGFIHTTMELATNEDARASFDADMVITNVTIQEANPERNLPEKAIVKGCIFDFRKQILPVEFSAINPKAIAYFEGCSASPSEPVFTRVKGKQVSETVVRQIVEESAFGEASVREVTNSRKDWVITWAQPDVYAWDDESTITAEELQNALAERQLTIAALKQRNEEYKASRGGATVAAAAPAKTSTTRASFNF